MRPEIANTSEGKRLIKAAEGRQNWIRWGPYLSERQWGTVREDYSEDGNCWGSFPHDHARSRVYRWGEDGLMGICDRRCRLCFSLAMWNGQDVILKERLFGLTNSEGNHGEDVKEHYFYLNSTPTHSYMRALYQYPQSAFPYDELREENLLSGKSDREYELVDTGVFDEDRYFDVFSEYAKASPNDILVKVTVKNRGPEDAPLHMIPMLWYRNTWIWGCRHEDCTLKPQMRQTGDCELSMVHQTLGEYVYRWEAASDGTIPQLLMTENESNTRALYGLKNYTEYTKDAFHRYIIDGEQEAVNPKQIGTRSGLWYSTMVPAGGEVQFKLRLMHKDEADKIEGLGEKFDRVFKDRQVQHEVFYHEVIPDTMSEEDRSISRQAYAGLLWTKQFYHYSVEDWLNGDPNCHTPPESRKHGRNHDWKHLFNRDVISMPDAWEYPWYAAWDLAFHMLAFAKIDPFYAKYQLELLLREWYMHPNGQMPAYEFNFSDVNPPVHAWACWRVYKMTEERGHRDKRFLASVFQKLLINFTWWVNRKDVHGKHLFSGGFLGLDNIGVFDRSHELPEGGFLSQADGTAWMAFYCGTMLSMALELAEDQPEYEDMASKFFEHFVAITDAMNHLGDHGLWDEEDGFYYDQLTLDGEHIPLRLRSMVGLLPICAVEVFNREKVDKLKGFCKRTEWFMKHRRDLKGQISFLTESAEKYYLLAIPSLEKLIRVLKRMLDETEFLSPYGLRSMSRSYADKPFKIKLKNKEHVVEYKPAESDTSMFGGNSNWRGPIWFPLNYLMVEALERYYRFYGDDVRVECPTGSGNMMNLWEVAREIEGRLVNLFRADEHGRRPLYGDNRMFDHHPVLKNPVWFYEFFDGDNGRGCGASHQTGWTALVANMLENLAREQPK